MHSICQFCGSGSGWIRNFFLDPESLFRIQQKMNEQINTNFISTIELLYEIENGR